MAMNVTPFVGTDNFDMATFNNMISQINSGVNSEISEVLAQLGTKAKIQTGTYVGTGQYGDSNPCSLVFDFEPEFVFVFKYNATILPFYAYDSGGTCTECMIWLNKSNSCMDNTGANYCSFDESTNTLSWYGEYTVGNYQKARMQLNASGTTYKYIAVG